MQYCMVCEQQGMGNEATKQEVENGRAIVGVWAWAYAAGGAL